MIIYKIKNKITNKVYIGFTTKPLEERWKKHLQACKIKDYIFYRAIKKYGSENFELQELEKCSSEEQMKEKEKIWIAIYNSANSNFGYNSTLGGQGGVPTDKVRKKISESLLGEKNGFYGKKHSLESKLKMSRIHTGKILSPEHKQKLLNANKGRKRSEETKLKMKNNANKDTPISHKNIPILQFDLQGNFIKEWTSIIDAENFYNIKNISRVCRNKRKSVGGFSWKYKQLNYD